ncbi:hypothetical protein RND81_10G107500 [Saponaria officinalis]|uniref:Transmembrane protein n=1 Tax=Saponaria officinalis TaxID=3572 RepID=A0AAW1I1S2_SAPOF
MAKEASVSNPWFLDVVPLLVVLLIAAHVIALVYWIFRLATEKQQTPPFSFRRKEH